MVLLASYYSQNYAGILASPLVTAITESTLTKLGNAKLSLVTKSLCGPDRKPLEVTGRVKATLYSKNHKCDHEVYVIKEQKHNLLGLPAIKELQLLKQIDHISLNHSSIINKYPNFIFWPWKIHQKSPSDQKQNCLQSIHPTRFHYHFIRKCRMIKLAHMESLGIISKVDTPTSWCAGTLWQICSTAGVPVACWRIAWCSCIASLWHISILALSRVSFGSICKRSESLKSRIPTTSLSLII